MTPLRRTPFLKVMLVLTVLSNLAGIAKLTVGAETLRAAHPQLTDTAMQALLVCPIAAIVGAVLLWTGRAIGYWILVVDAVVVIAVDLDYGMPIEHLIAVVVLTALLSLAFAGARRPAAG